jgi:hypothetical protein
VHYETGEERIVLGQCKTCARIYPSTSGTGIISPSGCEHIGVEDGMTACGRDATGDQWWWPV